MADYGVKLGSMLFTMVQPWAGHEREYNRWYERDHFYAGCLIGPYCFAGGRWVATSAMKDLRFPDESPITPDKRDGSFLSLYYILAEHRPEWRSWGAQQVFALSEQGRMFPQREHVHTLHYLYEWGEFRDEDGVPAELALDHRFPGLAVVMVERASAAVSNAEIDAWYRETYLPGALAGTPAAMCLAFRGEASMPDTPSKVPAVGNVEGRTLLLFFLDSSPEQCWESLFVAQAEAFDASGLGKVVFASPFLPTVPGTDTHIDDL